MRTNFARLAGSCKRLRLPINRVCRMARINISRTQRLNRRSPAGLKSIVNSSAGAVDRKLSHVNRCDRLCEFADWYYPRSDINLESDYAQFCCCMPCLFHDRSGRGRDSRQSCPEVGNRCVLDAGRSTGSDTLARLGPGGPAHCGSKKPCVSISAKVRPSVPTAA
jgi:hypothetical protein